MGRESSEFANKSLKTLKPLDHHQLPSPHLGGPMLPALGLANGMSVRVRTHTHTIILSPCETLASA